MWREFLTLNHSSRYLSFTAALSKVGANSPVLASPRNILGFPPFVWPNPSVPMDTATLISEFTLYITHKLLLMHIM